MLDAGSSEHPTDSFSVKEFYVGKNVLLTGSTGFIGKVILEKLLHSCPMLNHIYVMVRPKRNVKPMDRIKNEILSSPCFDELKSLHADFMEFAQSKIVPVEGDLIAEGLGFSP